MSHRITTLALALALSLGCAVDTDGSTRSDMSGPYAGDPNLFPDTILLPDTSDDNDASLDAAILSGLADRTAFNLARRLKPILVPLFGGQAISRFAPFANTSGRISWIQTDITDQGEIWWHAQIDPTVRITSIVMSLDGWDGPGGPNPGLPAPGERPLFRAYRQPTDGSNAELLATAADESASQAAYEAHHTIVMSPIVTGWPAEFAADEYLVLEYLGQTGANAAANSLTMYGLRINVELVPIP